MFEIKRSALLDDLLKISTTDSVLITGAPGVGKSWLIGEFLKTLQNAGRFVLALSAEEFQVDSVAELTSQIGLRQSIPDLFASRGEGSILIVDGLDALRGESSQRVFRDVLLEVLGASTQTHVVATIRTFDLAESPIFSALSGNLRGALNPFKTIVVGPLSDSELTPLRETRSSFDQLWTSASSETREMLRNPFNLGIALALLRDGFPPDQLSLIGSQVRLLGEYWKTRVEASTGVLDRKRLLRDLLEQMISVRLLTISETDLSQRVSGEALYSLLSNEVLRKGPTGRVGFSHNILFDYAVARLLLDEIKLIAFVRDDPTRALYYRPSLDFFFAHLWVADKTLFWRVVGTVFKTDRIPESTAIVPAVILCQMADSTESLSPLMADPAEDIVAKLLPKVLLGVQVLGIPSASRRTIWLNLIEQLSFRPSLAFINEIFGVLVLLQQSARLSERPVLSGSARRIVEWSWSYGEVLPPDSAADIASVVTSRLLPVVLATFDSDLEENNTFVRRILARIGNPRAATNELFWLTNDIAKIIDADPRLAADVFRAVYDYTETSEAETKIGGGTVLNLISNRRQDYETIRYALGVRFKLLIDRDPLLAASTSVWAVNAEVKQQRLLSDGDVLKQMSVKPEGYHTLTYIADYSEIWDSSSGRDYTSLQMLNAVLRFAQDASDQNLCKAVVKAVISDASVAVIFKHLLETASRSPAVFYDSVLALVKVPRLISAPEVTIAVGEFLKASSAGELIRSRDHLEIEQAIWRISRSRPLLRYERSKAIQRRLLSCLDREQLVDERSKKLLSDVNGIRENRPFFSMKGGVSQVDSQETLMRMRGIDPDDSRNRVLINATEAVRTFGQRYLNENPPGDEAANILGALVNLKDAISSQSESAAGLHENARGVLLATVETVLRNDRLSREAPIFQFCRAAALKGAEDPSPVFEEQYHLPFDQPGWGGPSPRIEAAQAIVHLVWNYPPDPEAFLEFEKLARDQVPAVRFQIARGLLGLFIREESRAEFWRLFRQMSAIETTNGVLVGLMDSLQQVAQSDPEAAVAAVHEFLERDRPKSRRSDVMRIVLNVLVGLYVARFLDSARDELSRFDRDVDKYHAELSEEILAAAKYLSPADSQNPEIRLRARSILQQIINTLRSTTEQKLRLPARERNFQFVARVMDTMASRMFFTFDLIGHRAPDQREMSDSQRRQLYSELRQTISDVTQSSVSNSDESIPLVPQAAHHLLQLMNGILSFEPSEVLINAYAICRHGARTGYLMDSMARSEAVKLVEAAIADHREVLRDTSVAQAVGGMLNLFIAAGWTEAIGLTFKLDQAFR